MAIREIVKIDEDKCDGCGLCVPSCHEGAIKIIDGKARLIADNLCDGLGNCLGECPRDAITIERREADEYDEELVEQLKKEQTTKQESKPLACGCPGSHSRTLKQTETKPAENTSDNIESRLIHWPVQLHLVPPSAPYLKNADILFVADCVPFAYADFHRKILKDKPVIVGCPKLDDANYYVEKLADIIKTANISSITVVRMEVPCCSGLVAITKMAKQKAGVEIPIYELTISVDGHIK